MNFIRFMLILTFSFEAASLRSVTGWSSLKLLRKVNPSISTSSNWPEEIKVRYSQSFAFGSELKYNIHLHTQFNVKNLPNGIPVSLDKVHLSSPMESFAPTVRPKRT